MLLSRRAKAVPFTERSSRSIRVSFWVAWLVDVRCCPYTHTPCKMSQVCCGLRFRTACLRSPMVVTRLQLCHDSPDVAVVVLPHHSCACVKHEQLQLKKQRTHPCSMQSQSRIKRARVSARQDVCWHVIEWQSWWVKQQLVQHRNNFWIKFTPVYSTVLFIMISL